jgi:hypothetical protein
MSRWCRYPALRTSRHGLTLTELLVAMGMMSFLCALIMPAIQQSREAARRVECRNHLRQLALSVHTFHDLQGTLPPSEIADSWATWAVFILPEMGESSLYARWDLSRRYYVQPASAGRDLRVFHCPSRSSVIQTTGSAGMFADGIHRGPPGWSDYAACGGNNRNYDSGAFVRAQDIRTGLPSTQLGSGASDQSSRQHPGWKPRLSFRDLSNDGLSTTILFGEQHIPAGFSLESVYNGDHPSGFLRILGGSADNPARFPLVADPQYRGFDWRDRFGGPHVGMCQFSLADGSVWSLSVNTSIEILDRLARRNDGLPVSLP